jgi:DeoR family L-fucose operon activator
MLALQRHREIQQLLQRKGSVRTVDLATRLKVTDETIRRDLETLENEGRLIRTHGGAVRRDEIHQDLPLDTRQLQQRDEKERIGRAAVSRIKPHDIIMLDASSTALQVAVQMPDMPVTVITNAHNVITTLQDRSAVRIVATGGVYDRQSRSYIRTGPVGLLACTNIDIFFFSGNGIDPQRGVSEINEDQAQLKAAFIPLASQVCCLADHTKLFAKSSYFFAGLDQIDVLITDRQTDADSLKTLEEHGIAIEVV